MISSQQVNKCLTREESKGGTHAIAIPAAVAIVVMVVVVVMTEIVPGIELKYTKLFVPYSSRLRNDQHTAPQKKIK
jgi:uncharacterized membrane protein YdfJ with MMPL/SSD domain